ncbi:error-prone DNA polymerase [Opitutus sp. ER46]|uniref:DNA polymerase III subunit alpha n=1 Tax=Opitutus sp. ER46 TaxID=2161864 RepID=UPI000D303ABD|nr:error-prone DNA polymerase [Opitutus sp. ER46]PTY00524.1 error-prone DNA polymerase [Opitutus sp. ER46]
MSYVELHARSAFSFLRGASNPEDLAKAAAAQQLPALALLDRDGVYGAPRLFGPARENGLRALVGAEITLLDGAVVPLLAATPRGYQNLCQLITEAKLTPRPGHAPTPDSGPTPAERKRPCFATWDELARFSDGLIALTGDEEGPVRRAWRTQGAAAASAALDPLLTIFGPDRLFLEVQRHRVRGEERELRFLRDLAAARRLPLLATGGVTYATRSARPVADVFTCLRHHTTLDAAGCRLSRNDNRQVKSAAEMAALFPDLPEALANTSRLAERVTFSLRDLGYRFPEYPVPPGHTMPSFLRECAYAGCRERYSRITPRIRRQLEKELALITKLGFSGYFLIVWDICRFCREQHILVQGRGSAANSLVCYALRVTAVDPIKCRLLFERFLSEGRVGADGHPSWPDIDLDLPSGDLRERVIQEIYQRYAPRGASMTANVITYRGRSTIRELGKVLGFGDDALDRFSSLYANGDFPETLELKQQLGLAGIATQHPRAEALASLYGKVHGLPRHLGQHSGGMVICQGQLSSVVPLENASMPGRIVCQWDKDDCEDLGIVKVDFLGLGMMAVLQDTFALCAQREHPLELYQIPQNDRAVYRAMRAADTIGVFQIESRAQMATLPRFQPRTFYDVAMQVAIVRPGPIVGNLAHPLIRRRRREEQPDWIDPSVAAIVKPILKRTSGVILFQEQMLELSMKLAHFNGSEAEELRRAMGFTRHPERLDRALAKLCAALRAAGHNENVVRRVSESALSFAAYGFPESHAISFALLAYASTWLKLHHPAEFTASLLNNQPMGFYAPATILQDARRHGLKIRPVCVTASDWNCTVDDPATIRLGLRYVKGLRAASVEAMLAARRERAFHSLGDFLRRSPFAPPERRALAAVGALNTFAPHRRAALWQVEAAWSEHEALFKYAVDDEPDAELAGAAGANASFAGGGAGAASPLPPMSLPERLHADFAGLSLTVGTHPMALARPRLPELWRASDLLLGRDGERVTIGGAVICRQRPGTAKGFVFISLEDETGIANAVVLPQVFEQNRLVITQEPALRISGRLQHESGVIHIRAEAIAPLPEANLPTLASHDFR